MDLEVRTKAVAGSGAFNLASRFAAVADRQYHDLFSVIVIESDIGPMSEVDYPLAELWRQLIDRTANRRVLHDRFYALPDRRDGALGRVQTLGSQEAVKTGHVPQGRLRPLQARHFGGAASLPASSLANQASASSAVAYRPVVW